MRMKWPYFVISQHNVLSVHLLLPWAVAAAEDAEVAFAVALSLLFRVLMILRRLCDANCSRYGCYAQETKYHIGDRCREDRAVIVLVGLSSTVAKVLSANVDGVRTDTRKVFTLFTCVVGRLWR